MGWVPELLFSNMPGDRYPYTAFHAEKLVVLNAMLTPFCRFLNTLLLPQCAYTLIINT